MTLDELVTLDGVAFTELRRHLAFVCDRCGGRTMHIVPLWPDPREIHAAAMGVDTSPRLPGTLPPPRGAPDREPREC